jgi:hypothetical protein
MIASEVLLGLGMLGTPLAGCGASVLVLALSQVLVNAQIPIYNVNQLSLRQAITPPAAHGRMNATMRMAALGMIPLGSLAGGLLGSSIGLAPTMLLGAGVAVLAPLWLVAGSVYAIDRLPESILGSH